ncbi:type II secretion system F family protein [Pseudahrensia aquimaris]|uniref:Type II secretion system F family protein n=1 Tax=Pseudahrensia aquimaris TaxID=744461 RepID=A0ABW3FEW6_9HYPH
MLMDRNFLIFAALAMLVVGLIVYAVFYNSISNQKKIEQRRKSLSHSKAQKVQKQNNASDEKQRRKQREESIKKLNNQKSQNKDVNKPDLARKLQQAGMTITPKKFYVRCVVISVVFFLLPLMFGAPLYVAAGMSFIFGWGITNWFVSFKRKRRIKKFIMAFPGAIDIITRGIKSGLPLNDCLRIIGNDAREPVKSEFQKLVESTQVGLSVPDACKRLYENVPSAETNFFAIVISIQSGAGGNLAEALENLSRTLRERKAMADKIKAMAMEAKASSYIIGSLPIAIATLLFVVSPDFLAPLWQTQQGHKILVAIAILYAMGIGSIYKMMNFKF